VPIGVNHQLKAVVDPEFTEDRREMVADSRFTNEETLGDLAFLMPLAEQGNYFAFTHYECGNIILVGTRWRGTPWAWQLRGVSLDCYVPFSVKPLHTQGHHLLSL